MCLNLIEESSILYLRSYI